MSHRRIYIVDELEDGMRLDTLMGDAQLFPSRSIAAREIDNAHVQVNGATVQKKYPVRPGDQILYECYDEPAVSLIPEDIPLDIRFEDDHLIVLSKQADLVCHPSVGHEYGTLANALIAHCGSDHLGTLQGDDRPGIVHRLDKDTTGLMLAAKDDETQAALQDAIRVRDVDRRYLALVHGNIVPDTGLVDAPIARGVRDRMRMEVSEEPGARDCVTTFSVLERFDAGPFDEGYTFIECKLFTGRTHQIRVHMNYIHHPCVGDQLYGACRPKANQQLGRQFLHSYSLEFVHPITQERLSFIDPLPADLAACLEGIKDYSLGRTSYGEQVKQSLDSFERDA